MELGLIRRRWGERAKMREVCENLWICRWCKGCVSAWEDSTARAKKTGAGGCCVKDERFAQCYVERTHDQTTTFLKERSSPVIYCHSIKKETSSGSLRDEWFSASRDAVCFHLERNLSIPLSQQQWS